ncbi:MAG: nuclear transport factor 2 family protein [Povalibacter sp.]
MRKNLYRLMILALTGVASISFAEETADAVALRDTIKNLDATVFKAFNECDMTTFAKFFTPDVEFYHDLGGVTWSRTEVIANTQKNICGKRRRELVEGTLEVYPIKDYGAVEIGTHRFCDLNGPKCEGIGRFVHIWQNDGGTWRITRVISYDHRSVPK